MLPIMRIVVKLVFSIVDTSMLRTGWVTLNATVSLICIDVAQRMIGKHRMGSFPPPTDAHAGMLSTGAPGSRMVGWTPVACVIAAWGALWSVCPGAVRSIAPAGEARNVNTPASMARGASTRITREERGPVVRSEERRVGKEGRTGRARERLEGKAQSDG